MAMARCRTMASSSSSVERERPRDSSRRHAELSVRHAHSACPSLSLSPPAYPAVVRNDCPPQESATRAPSRVAALLHASVYQRLPPCTVRSVLRVLYRRLCRSVRRYAPRAPRSFFERVSLHVSLSTDHHVSSFFAHSFVTPSRGQRQLPLATASWPICITSAHPKKRAHYLSYLDPRPDRNNQHIDGRRPPPTTNDRSTLPPHTHT